MRYYLLVNVLHRCGKPTIYDSRLVHIDVNVYPRVTEVSIVSASTVNVHVHVHNLSIIYKSIYNLYMIYLAFLSINHS